MIYKKYPLFFLLTLSFAQSAYAVRNTESFDESYTTYGTLNIRTAPKDNNNVEKPDFMVDFSKLKFNEFNESSTGKERILSKGKINDDKSDLRKLLASWREEREKLNLSAVQSINRKAIDYLRKNKQPIGIHRDLMDSDDYIISENGTALRFSNSAVYIILHHPMIEDKKLEEVNATIDAGLNLFEVEEKAERLQVLKKLGKKCNDLKAKRRQALRKRTEQFYKGLFAPAA